MTIILPRLAQWLSGRFRSKPPQLGAPAPTAPRHPQQLRKILVAVARRRGQGTGFQLLVDQMTSESMWFLTKGALMEGDTVSLEVLLSGQGNVQLRGTVVRLHLTNTQQLRGQIALNPGSEELLAEFLRKDSLKQR